MGSKRNAKPLWNVPEFVDKAIAHYANVNSMSWTAALYQLVVRGYVDWTTTPERYGHQLLLNNEEYENELMAKFEAIPLKDRAPHIEQMLKSVLPKPGRPRKKD